LYEHFCAKYLQNNIFFIFLQKNDGFGKVICQGNNDDLNMKIIIFALVLKHVKYVKGRLLR
jgi:hypothetical protein